MAFKIRFLLTSKCTATCGYCHNEGQDKKGTPLLSVAAITHILKTLQLHDCVPEEIILSGGEPTLHKQVAQIARLCKATGAYVSMDSHGGHPALLEPALPYLDELKLHIDSFDPVEQQASMGLDIAKVMSSIRIAQQYRLDLRINHPLKQADSTIGFVAKARSLGVDCKVIDMFSFNEPQHQFAKVDWLEHGYIRETASQWRYADGTHRIFTKSCGALNNLQDESLFIGADGIRRAVDGIIIGQPNNFTIRMVKKEVSHKEVAVKNGI